MKKKLDNAKYLAKGIFRASQISIRHIPSTLHLQESEKKKFGAIWKNLKKEARAKKAPLFESEVYRLEKVDTFEKRLSLQLSTVPYSVVKTLREMQIENSDAKHFWSQAMFVCGIIRTTDNKYIFGVRGNSISKNTIDCIGGTFSKNDRQLNYGKDLFRAMEGEIIEELGVSRKFISTMALRAFILTPTRKVGCVFDVALKLGERQVQELFQKRSDIEMKNLVFIERSELKIFLDSLGGYKPKLWDIFKKNA